MHFFLIKKQSIYNCLFTCLLVLSLSLMYGKNIDSTKQVMSVPVSGKVIIIDAGHGSPDGGASGYSGALEKDINLAIAKELGYYLAKSGAHVVYTRAGDDSIAKSHGGTIRSIKKSDMAKRKNIRDNSYADIFLSIHMNSFPDSKYRGAQIFYSSVPDGSKYLAQCIQQEIKNIADSGNKREAKKSGNDIYLLRDTTIPSVLVECGFLSNKDEEQNLLTKAYQNKMAYAIYSGILKYLSNT